MDVNANTIILSLFKKLKHDLQLCMVYMILKDISPFSPLFFVHYTNNALFCKARKHSRVCSKQSKICVPSLLEILYNKERVKWVWHESNVFTLRTWREKNLEMKTEY